MARWWPFNRTPKAVAEAAEPIAPQRDTNAATFHELQYRQAAPEAPQPKAAETTVSDELDPLESERVRNYYTWVDRNLGTVLVNEATPPRGGAQTARADASIDIALPTPMLESEPNQLLERLVEIARSQPHEHARPERDDVVTALQNLDSAQAEAERLLDDGRDNDPRDVRTRLYDRVIEQFKEMEAQLATGASRYTRLVDIPQTPEEAAYARLAVAETKYEHYAELADRERHHEQMEVARANAAARRWMGQRYATERLLEQNAGQHDTDEQQTEEQHGGDTGEVDAVLDRIDVVLDEPEPPRWGDSQPSLVTPHSDPSTRVEREQLATFGERDVTLERGAPAKTTAGRARNQHEKLPSADGAAHTVEAAQQSTQPTPELDPRRPGIENDVAPVPEVELRSDNAATPAPQKEHSTAHDFGKPSDDILRRELAAQKQRVSQLAWQRARAEARIDELSVQVTANTGPNVTAVDSHLQGARDHAAAVDKALHIEQDWEAASAQADHDAGERARARSELRISGPVSRTRRITLAKKIAETTVSEQDARARAAELTTELAQAQQIAGPRERYSAVRLHVQALEQTHEEDRAAALLRDVQAAAEALEAGQRSIDAERNAVVRLRAMEAELAVRESRGPDEAELKGTERLFGHHPAPVHDDPELGLCVPDSSVQEIEQLSTQVEPELPEA